MIKCNLAVLLAERNIKISELSKRTGISRTTLTALAQNQSKGIQFDTFDTLCNYLKVRPNDLFIQESLEYDFEVLGIESNTDLNINDYLVTVSAEIQHNNHLIDITFPCSLSFWTEYEEVRTINIKPSYPGVVQNLLDSIPITFKVSIEQELLDAIKAFIIVELNLDESILEITIS
ncbi:helix-turn-helix domain-containing protein [Lysinibacillus sp. 54212]|uniref:helix-turn-helix domain-containing protein n=1 Tax=Lysinibacillus sp. 54212 TaxID=3119829 RepID=UPI002FC96DBB